jgi:superfamily II DNA or RNA helicase
VLTTTLELRELGFLIRQIDQYIQVMEFMIRKTPAVDQGELALARKLRTKLNPGKPTDHRRKNIANKPR